MGREGSGDLLCANPWAEGMGGRADAQLGRGRLGKKGPGPSRVAALQARALEGWVVEQRLAVWKTCLAECIQAACCLLSPSLVHLRSQIGKGRLRPWRPVFPERRAKTSPDHKAVTGVAQMRAVQRTVVRLPF